MTNILSYYIVDRKSGVSYDPYFLMSKVAIATSNLATRKGETVINLSKLATGLRERKYRLVHKSLAQ